MMKLPQEWIDEVKAFVIANGLEGELDIVREMIGEGMDLRQVSFMMRDRYPMAALQALKAEIAAEQMAKANVLPVIS